MSTMPPPPPTLPADPGPPAGPMLDVSGTPKIPFGRLVLVEWRKLIDTRGGLWLALSVGALLGIASTVVLLLAAFTDATTTANGLLTTYRFVILLILPVFAILTVTSEWSQRTALITFTLEPRRGAVIAAKWVAVTALAVAVVMVALILGALVNLLAATLSGNDVVWNLAVSSLFWTILQQMIYFWFAFALAMTFLNTPGSIAAFYVLALIWPFILLPLVLIPFVVAGSDSVFDVMPWVDLLAATTPLTLGEGLESADPEAMDYVRFFVTSAWWIGIPAALGVTRVLRSEVK